jgi:myo-inositol-1(or 4)-monophosphatase
VLAHSGFRRQLQVERKGRDTDLVTQYDRDTETLIRARLAARTPGLAVVGEEAGGQADGPTWFCDPIDGTTNFVHGLPWFCVSLGLLDGQSPLVGVIVAPALGTRYQGFVAPSGERRALRNAEPCRVSDTRELGRALLATGFHPRAPASELRANLAAMGRALPLTRGVRRCGSAALDLALVADGTYDAYWERTLNAWDIAGGAALVLAAGGRLSDLAGGPAELCRGHILASNGLLHPALLALLDEGGDRG